MARNSVYLFTAVVQSVFGTNICLMYEYTVYDDKGIRMFLTGENYIIHNSDKLHTFKVLIPTLTHMMGKDKFSLNVTFF